MPGRPKNILKTVILKISTTEVMVDSLEDLVLTGTYGKNSTEAAERLIAKGVQDLQKEGYIQKRKAKAV
jgi:hypothetical protein